MLYLVPTPIADNSPCSPEVRAAIEASDYFVVENLRTARRYISSLKLGRPIDELDFVELSEHTDPTSVAKILQPIVEGRTASLMSEAGLPCVADPGNILVAAAHQASVKVVPLVGPSSIMLALMASGASGQNFAFNGYIPIKADERAKALKLLERRAVTDRQSQIFIETPYRNLSLYADILKHCDSRLMLSLSANLTAADEYIATKSIDQWRKIPAPPIDKRPAIFILFTT